MMKTSVLPTMVLVFVVCHGCSSGGGGTTDPGSGGAMAGSGGAGSGGAPGSGGSGGAPGSGGAVGSGGSPGSGGAAGSGGAGAGGRDGGAGGATDGAVDSPPANCPAVASSWVGDYEIVRLVIHHQTFMDGIGTHRCITYSRAGARDQNGVTWSIKESSVRLTANGQVSAGYVLTQDGATSMSNSQKGLWMKEGTSTVVADWEGDSLYRRKFAVTVDGCLLKLVKTFPEDFVNAGAAGRYEHTEADLLRK